MFVGDSIVRKTDRALNKGDKNRGYHSEGGKNCGSGQGRFYFSTRRN